MQTRHVTVRQDAARAADRGAIAVHGRDAALTNFTLACYGADERQRAGADLAAFLASLRPQPPSRASNPDLNPDTEQNHSTGPSVQRCGYCAACRQPWRRGRHGRRLRCLNAPRGAGDVPGLPALDGGLHPPAQRCPGSRAAGSAAGSAAAAEEEEDEEAGAAEGQAASLARVREPGLPAQGRAGPARGAGGPGGTLVKAERNADVLARATRQLYAAQEERRAMDAAMQHGAPWHARSAAFCACACCAGGVPAVSVGAGAVWACALVVAV